MGGQWLRKETMKESGEEKERRGGRRRYYNRKKQYCIVRLWIWLNFLLESGRYAMNDSGDTCLTLLRKSNYDENYFNTYIADLSS